MLRNLLSALVLVLVSCAYSYAQVGQGALKGKVLDKESGEPLPFVNVALYLNGVYQTGGSTDFDGVFNIKPITPGTYVVKASFVGYQEVQYNGVAIKAEKTQFLDVQMSQGVTLKEAEVIEYTVPLFDKDETTVSTTVSQDDLVRMPARGASGVAATVGGVYSADDGSGNINIRGARSDANFVFIDGIKVRGSDNLPQSAIEQISVITGGVPAQYGDITGGIISITTRGPSSKYSGSVEYVTSGYKLGDDIYGLDQYGYNLMEASITGPIWMKKDSTGKKTTPLAGFFLSGNFTSTIDGRPSAIGTWRVKEDALNDLNSNPLRYATNGLTGTFPNAEFLRMNSFDKVQTRENAAANSLVLNAKLDFATGKNTNLTFGGTFQFNESNQHRYDYSLFNFDNNPSVRNLDWRAFGRFTQRFGNADPALEEKKASTIKNAYYSVQIDYSSDNYRRWDDTHQDDLFAYGYYGQFRRYQDRDYQDVDLSGTDSVITVIDRNTGAERQFTRARVQETFVDTLIGFAPSSLNPEGATFTSNYYNLFGWQGYDEQGNPVFDQEQASFDLDGNGTIDEEERNFYLRRFDNIRSNGGLVNGDRPRDIYNMWRSPALQWNSHDIRNRDQFRLTAMGSADIKNHAISLGFEYEQRSDRGYSVYPRGLWTIGELRVNSHITELDRSVADITFEGTYPTLNFERLNADPDEYSGDSQDEAQSFFDFNLRQSLGLDPNGTDFIDIHSLTPDQMKIDYFSANELLNNGQELVYYFGYDPYGNRTTDNPTIDDFFTATDEFGNFTRPIGAFRPNYVAGWIQDKFAFDDLVFNVGLRIDRYDANQSVLRDPYVLFPTIKAGERQTIQEVVGLELGSDYTIPGNIGNDYVVYVDNVQNPTRIVGYRDEDTWFNSDGVEIDDASVLEGSSGIAPLLVDRENTSSQDITSEAFEDYTPQINFMPRIAFSFPISDEATFFAHYDVLTKRPTFGGSEFAFLFDGGRLNPLDYYFLETRTASDIIANPDLQPETTIDYAVGFKQKISKLSAITIEASYREMRDQIQVVGVQQAFPKTYSTYDNRDFGTVKSLLISYDMRRNGNVSLRASYTLQFADGTGSDALGGANLVRSGQQNLRTTTALNYDQRHTIVMTLDYRYGQGKQYNGPTIGDFQVLQNTGANFQFNLGSGTPYTREEFATGTQLFSGGGQGVIDGTVNGSRLPWQFRLDMRLDRDITIKRGEGKSPLTLNVYMQMLNVLNSLNILRVYRFSGTPTDDGYLEDARYENDIRAQNDEQAFREMYTMKMQDYRNFSLPRRTRVGFILNF